MIELAVVILFYLVFENGLINFQLDPNVVDYILSSLMWPLILIISCILFLEIFIGKM